jgi:putative SOS response-associated peptidase YedK
VLENFAEDEKRMIVVLREEDQDAWLDAAEGSSMQYMRERLRST